MDAVCTLENDCPNGFGGGAKRAAPQRLRPLHLRLQLELALLERVDLQQAALPRRRAHQHEARGAGDPFGAVDGLREALADVLHDLRLLRRVDDHRSEARSAAPMPTARSREKEGYLTPARYTYLRESQKVRVILVLYTRM